MIIYRCTHEWCPRFGLRTEKVCQASVRLGGMDYSRRFLTFQPSSVRQAVCNTPAERDIS
jgi:hypothetical protein